MIYYFFKPANSPVQASSSIPKVIHYVWLGSQELPEHVQKAIHSWQTHQPNFQIKRWDEESCQLFQNRFAKEAYALNRLDYASDYCRIKALMAGGVYLDTDMILKAPIEPLLDEPINLTLQYNQMLSGSFVGVVANHPFIKMLADDYENRSHFSYAENAPLTWSKYFNQLFHEKPLAKRAVGQYHIHPANVFMYDFNGGENVAEHLFHAGSHDGETSKWYAYFRKIYLNENALYFPAQRKYFIFKNDKTGYFYDMHTNKAAGEIKYTHSFGLFRVFENEKHAFFCFLKKCYHLMSW